MERQTPSLHPSFPLRPVNNFLAFPEMQCKSFQREENSRSPSSTETMHTVFSKQSLYHLNGFRKSFISSSLAIQNKSQILNVLFSFAPLSSLLNSEPFLYFFFPRLSLLQCFSWRHAISISWETFLQWGLADNCLP